MRVILERPDPDWARTLRSIWSDYLGWRVSGPGLRSRTWVASTWVRVVDLQHLTELNCLHGSILDEDEDTG
jgi:hypothetical protein